MFLSPRASSGLHQPGCRLVGVDAGGHGFDHARRALFAASASAFKGGHHPVAIDLKEFAQVLTASGAAKPSVPSTV